MTLPALLLAFALNPVTEYCLRNVAATEAAQAVSTFATQRKLDVTVTAEPVANTVRVVGDAAGRQRIRTLLASIDRPPPQAVCQILVAQAPAGFADAVGLGLSRHDACALTAREVRMLIAAIGQAKRAGGKGIDIMSRPTLTILDNQTGLFEVGSPNGPGLLARVTPRMVDDGKTLLRAETRLNVSVSGDGTTGLVSHESRVTVTLEASGGLVVRSLVGAADDGRPCEVLWLITVTRVGAEPADNAGTTCPTVTARPDVGRPAGFGRPGG